MDISMSVGNNLQKNKKHEPNNSNNNKADLSNQNSLCLPKATSELLIFRSKLLTVPTPVTFRITIMSSMIPIKFINNSYLWILNTLF